MFFKLFILFTVIPIIEIAILVKLGTLIGFWPTIFILVGTGILGASLAKIQGFAVWRRIQNEIRSGNVPAEELVDGLLIFIGGLLLLTPGLLTDFLGFLMLIPWSRLWLKKWLRKKFREMTHRRQVKVIHFAD